MSSLASELDWALVWHLEVIVRRMVRCYGTKYRDDLGLITMVAINGTHFSIIDYPTNSGIQIFIPGEQGVIYGTFATVKPDSVRLRMVILPMIERYMVLDELAAV
jgi:hypothetical protein